MTLNAHNFHYNIERDVFYLNFSRTMIRYHSYMEIYIFAVCADSS